jgi:hypothetical protein
MRPEAKAIILFIILIVFNTTTVCGFNIKLIKKIPLAQETGLLENVWDFCVTGDNLFLIPDYKAGNVKIFAQNGSLVKILGRKGFGPEELVRPAFCFYNKEKGKFGVFDFGTRKIFIYNRIGKTGFKRVKEIYCLAGTTGIQLKDNKLLVSGYKSGLSGTHYDFYYVDLTNDQTTFLLPSYYKYGLTSWHQFKTQYINKPGIKAIGIAAWFDICGDNAYFAWEGDLRIIKINIKSEKIEFFGKKPSHYIKPFASKSLLEAHRTRDIKIIENEWDKMSYIKDIFATSKYVLVIYKGPVKPGSESNTRMQFYTLNGNYLEDIPIPGNPGSRMCFDKDKDILYSLSSEVHEELLERYFVLEYKVGK